MLSTSLIGSKKVVYATANESKENLIYIKKLIEDGKLKPIIDKSFSIMKISDAHEYVESGRKKGNVIVINDWK